MRTGYVALGIGILLALAGCSTPGPSAVEPLPAAASGKGRVYLYRLDGEPASFHKPPISLNGQVVWDPEPGTFFFVDQLAGEQEVALKNPNPALGGALNRASAPLACLVMWPWNTISRAISGHALPGLEVPCDNDEITLSRAFSLGAGEVVYLRIISYLRSTSSFRPGTIEWASADVIPAEQARKEIEGLTFTRR